MKKYFYYAISALLMASSVITTSCSNDDDSLNEIQSDKPTITHWVEPYHVKDGTVEDAHVILHKCRISEAPDFTINDSSGDFGDCTFTGVAVPTNNKGLWWDMVLQAKASDIGAE